jgi:hypothetical protein
MSKRRNGETMPAIPAAFSLRLPVFEGFQNRGRFLSRLGKMAPAVT